MYCRITGEFGTPNGIRFCQDFANDNTVLLHLTTLGSGMVSKYYCKDPIILKHTVWKTANDDSDGREMGGMIVVVVVGLVRP